MFLQLNFQQIFSEIFIIIGASLLFLIDRFVKFRSYAFIFTLFLLLFLIVALFLTPFGKFTNSFSVDFYSATIKLFLYVGTLFIVFVFYHFLKNHPPLNYGEIYGLVLFSLLGAIIAVSALDLVTMYLGIELLSIPVYFLIAANGRYLKASPEGALKYFIVGCLSSVFFWLAIGVFYYLFGTFDLKNIFLNLNTVSQKGILLFGLLALLTAFSIKMALVPFHMWGPDAYQAAPIPVTAFLAGIVKLAALSALVKVLVIAFSPLRFDLPNFLIPIVLLTILIGNVLAIKQDDLIRMLAYSSIAHAGYAFLGILSAEFYGYAFAIYYMVVYLFTITGTFAILSYFCQVNRAYLSIPNLSGLSKALPSISLFLLIFLFSLAGVPPTAGFMAKFYVFLSLVKGQQVLVGILALLFSVIGAYPYLRVLKIMYMDPLPQTPRKASYGLSFIIPTYFTVFIVIILGLFPNLIAEFIQKTLFLYLSLLYFHF